MEENNMIKWLNIFTCYTPGRSKTLSKRGCMGSIFSLKYSKLTFGPLSLIYLFYFGKTKKDRPRVNRKAPLTWVGDSVGGLLGGNKAYRKLTLKHHPDKMKRSMKGVFKVRKMALKLRRVMPSQPLRTIIWFLYGLNVEIRPKWTPPGAAYPPVVGATQTTSEWLVILTGWILSTKTKSQKSSLVTTS